MRKRAIALAGLAGLIAGGIIAGFTAMTSGDAPGVQTGKAAIGGPFTLTAADGTTVTEDDLLGKPTAIFFGFTFCPDVCPTTLYELSGLMDEMGEAANELNVVFVSVDWERDKPEDVGAYLGAFDERIVGLTGTEEQIETVTDAYRVYYERVPVEGGNYTIDHTASVFLMDEEGAFFGTLDYEEPRETMLGKLKRLVESA